MLSALARIVISDQVRATHKISYPMALLVTTRSSVASLRRKAEQCSKNLHHIMCNHRLGTDMPLDAEEGHQAQIYKPQAPTTRGTLYIVSALQFLPRPYRVDIETLVPAQHGHPQHCRRPFNAKQVPTALIRC